ncbi:MAG: hypothetical protein JNK64_23790 [Myxococcales bacterium]|nr:hypothetical protein [Myxococcales bacterium]
MPRLSNAGGLLAPALWHDRTMRATSAWRLLWSVLLAACGGEAGGQGGDAGPDAPTGARPHPLYPALDLDALPGDGGGAIGRCQPPALPTTTRQVTITTTGAQAGRDVLVACATAGTAVTVPDAAGRIGTLDLGDVDDCDLSLGAAVVVDLLYVGHLPGPVRAPSHRVRVRGGQLGAVMVDPQSTDLVLDGVVINTGVRPAAQRSSVAIYLLGDRAVADGYVARVAVVDSIIRMVATEPDAAGNRDGCAYLADGARDVFFANNNVVTAGNRNSWGFRISGGDNALFVDNAVRVSFHKLIRMNDGPVDYVYVKGGTWMREATLTAGGLAANDSWAQLGDLGTDHVYLHDAAVWMLSTEPVAFGASFGPGQVGKRWEARRIDWHARSAGVVSDAHLQGLADGCTAGATCDYGVGSHRYTYAADLALPTMAWRDLPTIAVDDPDQQPIAP